jgi:hypothetical protein
MHQDQYRKWRALIGAASEALHTTMLSDQFDVLGSLMVGLYRLDPGQVATLAAASWDLLAES